MNEQQSTENDAPVETCESLCWMAPYARDAECSRPKGHDGAHVDTWEGWEW